jgi:hypothetical protein
VVESKSDFQLMVHIIPITRDRHLSACVGEMEQFVVVGRRRPDRQLPCVKLPIREFSTWKFVKAETTAMIIYRCKGETESC